MNPRRIVTLLTDFGTRDGCVAAMKGVILGAAPDVNLVDAAHDLAPQDVAGAAWVLRQYATLYPAGTIHMAVVDPGVGTERRVLCVEADGRFYLAPDNGLLWWVLRDAKTFVTAALRPEIHRPVEISATFHGRDVFAHAAGLLARGTAMTALAEAYEPKARPEWGETASMGATLKGRVIHVDRFGNLITNIPAAALNPRASGQIEIRVAEATITALSRTFSDVQPGALVAYIGSGGTLEIAVNLGSAAEALSVRPGAVVTVGAQ